MQIPSGQTCADKSNAYKCGFLKHIIYMYLYGILF